MNRKIVGSHCPSIPYLGDGPGYVLLAVLIEDRNTNTQIAYHGIVPVKDAGTVQGCGEVAARGAKLTYEQAREHWPSIEKKRYQR